MDYFTVATVITLVFSGAALCYWPMSLKIGTLKEELGLALRAREIFAQRKAHIFWLNEHFFFKYFHIAFFGETHS